MKPVLTTLLLLFAAASLVFVLVSDGPVAGDAHPSGADVVAVEPELVVYYMDMGKDCTTCLSLEAYTREALDTYYIADLASGRIAWRTADLDDPANAHFVDEFGLYTKSVVLVRFEGGKQTRFDSLSRIWELVYDKDAYIAYIRDEVKEFLDAAGTPE
jgi:hypothetical protein